MRDENVYRKRDNGRYIPFGVVAGEDYLPDGVWFIQHRDNCYSKTNCTYLPSKFYMPFSKIDLNLVCSMEDTVRTIEESKEYRDLISRKEGYSIDDIISVAVKVMYDMQEKKE